MFKRCILSPQEVTVITTINRNSIPCPSALLPPWKGWEREAGSRGQESDEAVTSPSEGADK